MLSQKSHVGVVKCFPKLGMIVSCFTRFSSEDELDVLLNGTPDQKKKLIREYLTGESESSSGDDFEKEMEAELSSTIKTMEGTWGAPATGNLQLLQQHSAVVLTGPRCDLYWFVLQKKVAAAHRFPTPGCMTRCTSTPTRRKRTRQVGMTVFL